MAEAKYLKSVRNHGWAEELRKRWWSDGRGKVADSL
jgi:hypothetical protein